MTLTWLTNLHLNFLAPEQRQRIFVERLCRSVKYEEVYLKDYQTMKEAATGLGIVSGTCTTTSTCTAPSAS